MKALLAALLLVLAASPLTAPFSVHAPLSACDDHAAWASAKKLADDLKTDAVPSTTFDPPGIDWSVPPQRIASLPPDARRQDHFPLRL